MILPQNTNPKIRKNYHNNESTFEQLKKYVQNIKIRISKWFEQYLKPDGKKIMIKFNRYMLLIMILNLDMRFLLMLIFLTLIVIKILKLNQLKKKLPKVPLNFITKRIEKQKQKQNSYTDPNIQTIKNPPLLIRISAKQLQLKIYQHINKTMKSICNFIWFAKWKWLHYSWIVILIVYIFQPNVGKNDFHIITTHNQGNLFIQTIQAASIFINAFYLAIIWIFINIFIFYYNATQKFYKDLYQTLYQPLYYSQIIRQTKLKTSKNLINEGNISINLKINNEKLEFDSKGYKTYNSKTKLQSNFDLIPFIKSQQKLKANIQNQLKDIQQDPFNQNAKKSFSDIKKQNHHFAKDFY